MILMRTVAVPEMARFGTVNNVSLVWIKMSCIVRNKLLSKEIRPLPLFYLLCYLITLVIYCGEWGGGGGYYRRCLRVGVGGRMKFSSCLCRHQNVFFVC